jgi:hypothetical protein
MIHYSITVFALLATTAGYSQVKDTANSDPNLSKVVHVVTEYEPSISDANRINSLPQVDDTLAVKPAFNYTIASKPIHPDFELTPINAAKMKGEPLTRLYRGIFTGGLGNYLSTLANLQLSSVRSKKMFFNSEFNHQGSFGDLKVDGVNQKATTSDNYLKLTGKRFIDKKEIYASLGGKFDLFHTYGIDNAVQAFPDDIALQYSSVNIETGIRSLYLDSGAFNYNVKPHFELFKSKTDNESAVGVETEVEKLMGEFSVNGLLNLNYINGVDQTTDLLFNPYALIHKGNFNGKVGFATQLYAGGYSQFHLYPDVYAEYNAADNIFVPFVVCNGFSQWGGIAKLVEENPYVAPGTNAAPTSYNVNITGGVKGLMSSFVPYSMSATFSQVDNMHFFVPINSLQGNIFIYTLSYLSPYYTFETSSTNVFNFHGELGYKKFEKLNITYKFDYFTYNTKDIPSAYNKPSVITTLNFRYDIQHKIIVNLDLFYVGDRTTPVTTVKGFVDANLGVEYRLTKRVSGFANLNNVAAQNYQYWANYPVQRFNALFGFSYAFWGE